MSSRTPFADQELQHLKNRLQTLQSSAVVQHYWTIAPPSGDSDVLTNDTVINISESPAKWAAASAADLSAAGVASNGVVVIPRTAKYHVCCQLSLHSASGHIQSAYLQLYDDTNSTVLAHTEWGHAVTPATERQVYVPLYVSYFGQLAKDTNLKLRCHFTFNEGDGFLEINPVDVRIRQSNNRQSFWSGYSLT